MKKTVIFILALTLASLMPVLARASGETLYESYTTGDDTNASIYTVNWVAQSFTTTQPHTINSLRLYLQGIGTPGTLTVGIRATNATGYPIGNDLCSGTLASPAGLGWYNIPVDEYNLAVNTTYAIVASGTGTSASNCIAWRYDTDGSTYTGGDRYNSTNAGGAWTKYNTSDLLFEIYGNPSMQIYGANVYSGYMSDNDWLVVVKGINTAEPYYSTSESKSSFSLQLTKADDTLIAQTPLPAWGYKPCSIYLSNTTTATLDWGAAYKVKFVCMDNASYNTSYTLTSADWRGSELSILDAWCLDLARALENYYSTTFIVATASKGDVLNEEGGVIFLTGIPYLDAIRPGIFQIVTSGIPYTPGTWSGGYETSLPTWETAVGADIAAFLNDTGGLINVDGKTTGIFFIVLIYIAIAMGVFIGKGEGTAGMLLGLPVLWLGVYFRFIPWQAIGVVTVFMVVFAIRQLVWR